MVCGAELLGWVVLVFGSLARSWATRLGSIVVGCGEFLTEVWLMEVGRGGFVR